MTNEYQRRYKIIFLYEGPHSVHATWAKSIGAIFIPDLDAGPKMGSSWPKRLFNAFRRLFILNRIPKDTDVLLLEGGLGFIVGFLFKKFRKGKVVMIVSDPLLYLFKKNFLLRKIGYFMIKDFDGFIPTSSLMANLIPFKNKKIVYPFVNIKKFRKIKPTLNSTNLIYVGILNKQKGVDRVVKLFLKIQRIIPSAKLFLVGEGPLKRKIEKIKNKNIILTGFTPNPENYLRRCVIYVNLSRVDAFGVGVLEAMVSGLVPVISENVGAKDLVKMVDEKLIVKEEKEAMETLLNLLGDLKKLKIISKKVQKIALEQTKKESIKNFRKAFLKFILK